MIDRFKKLMPTRESLHNNRWLNWLGPRLHHPRLWHMSRKGIAMGLALGVFFGFLIPVAQIPFSATFAVVLRANVPVAIASTLVTNPVTFGPVYFGAYHLGKWVLREDEPTQEELQSLLDKPGTHQGKADDLGFWGSIKYAWHELGKVGKPLFVGLALVATFAGFTAYFLVHAMWVVKVRWSRQRRIQKMRNPG
jgi:uncharacterized protein